MEIQNLAAFLDYFEKVHQRTTRVARSIPHDKIDWSYKEGKFTLGDLVRHIATSTRYLFVENALGRPSRYNGCGRELADGYDAVMAFADRLHSESVGILSQFTPEDLNRKVKTPDGTPITAWKWLRLMVEHEIHHRGQIYLYLALLGVPTPPLYGMTSEQVLERSAQSQRTAGS
jgi:uncharacterized damage-inducible protein DinB